MALVAGTYTTSGSKTPSSSTYTFAGVTQDVGSNGLMVIMIANTSDTSASITSVTYGGQTMTQIRKDESQTTPADYYYSFSLSNPPTGSNSVVITWNSGQYNPIQIDCFAFTGSGGIGNNTANTSTAPVTVTTTVSANSILIGYGWSTGGSGSGTMTGATEKWYTLLYNYIMGGISSNLSAGSQSITFSPIYSGSMTGTIVEIKEFTGGGGLTSKNTQIVWI